jgi:hypothetical protein
VAEVLALYFCGRTEKITENPIPIKLSVIRDLNMGSSECSAEVTPTWP